MIYVVAVFFSISLSWLTSFLWVDYISFVLGTELIATLRATAITETLIGASYFALASVVAMFGVVPSLETRDFQGGLINASVVGVIAGIMIAAIARLNTPDLDWTMTLQQAALAPVFTIAMGALVYVVSDLLIYRQAFGYMPKQKQVLLLEFSSSSAPKEPRVELDLAA